MVEIFEAAGVGDGGVGRRIIEVVVLLEDLSTI